MRKEIVIQIFLEIIQIEFIVEIKFGEIKFELVIVFLFELIILLGFDDGEIFLFFIELKEIIIQFSIGQLLEELFVVVKDEKEDLKLIIGEKVGVIELILEGEQVFIGVYD